MPSRAAANQRKWQRCGLGEARTMFTGSALERDAQDPLAGLRDRFVLPRDQVYLAGNSLGALPDTVAARLERAVHAEWGEGAVRSWNRADWIGAPRRVGD